MDNTTSDELPKMIRVVEQYIKDKTGKRVNIVFNDKIGRASCRERV